MRPIIAVPATALLVARAWSNKSLTPAGLAAATVTAAAHAYHPWNLPFVLLCVFFLAGSRVTRIKHDVKASLTISSKGSAGGEGPRTHIQVFANSIVASILSLLHGYQLRARMAAYDDPRAPNPDGSLCFSWGGDLLMVGIIANYAAVAADTFSSELGILSREQPRLITSPTLRKVPRGTNGGVTLMGLGAGLAGSVVIVTAAMMSLPVCSPEWAATGARGTPWTLGQRRLFMASMVLWGALGSLLDSLLGGLFQQSVKDTRTGRIVEGEGGRRVLVSASGQDRSGGASTRQSNVKGDGIGKTGRQVLQEADPRAIDGRRTGGKDPSWPRGGDHDSGQRTGDDHPSRVAESGQDLLDNNEVNLLMASMMSIGAMALAGWYWGVSMKTMMRP